MKIIKTSQDTNFYLTKRGLNTYPHTNGKQQQTTNKQEQNHLLRTNSSQGYRVGGLNIFYWLDIRPLILLLLKQCGWAPVKSGVPHDAVLCCFHCIETISGQILKKNDKNEYDQEMPKSQITTHGTARKRHRTKAVTRQQEYD